MGGCLWSYLQGRHPEKLRFWCEVSDERRWAAVALDLFWMLKDTLRKALWSWIYVYVCLCPCTLSINQTQRDTLVCESFLYRKCNRIIFNLMTNVDGSSFSISVLFLTKKQKQQLRQQRQMTDWLIRKIIVSCIIAKYFFSTPTSLCKNWL